MIHTKTSVAIILIIWWILSLFNRGAIKKQQPTEDKKETQLGISIY